MLIHANSLSQTVDAIHAATCAGARTVSASERTDAARWIAARQGKPRAYGGAFAGFDGELARGVVLFTGERITSASARHILGEEACRALQTLKVRDREVNAALARATAGLLQCLQRAAEQPRNANPGTFCCGKCTVGVWRNLLSGGLDRQAERLHRGVDYLRSMRDGDGQWRKFPYWYTVLALSEMDFPAARQELKYASATLDRTARRAPGSSIYAQRRHALAERTLTMSS
jgi:hypothetical protein